MPRPKQRTTELRDHVLRVAMSMLEKDGIAAFTARRIAETADTSMPAIYELFGDKAGLLRALFFEGFRRLHGALLAPPESSDARGDLMAMCYAFRAFARAHPNLGDLMFSRRFADFMPGPEERSAGNAVREFIVGRVRRCVDAGALVGDETDIAHVLLAVCQGLALQERAGWLGTSKASVGRRWQLAIEAFFCGFS